MLQRFQKECGINSFKETNLKNVSCVKKKVKALKAR